MITPQRRSITDVGKGVLAVRPVDYSDLGHSDDVNCGGGFGPSWVSALVNAVGKSCSGGTPRFSSVGRWGGRHDHVPPEHVDYDGLGLPRAAARRFHRSLSTTRFARALRNGQHFEVHRKRLRVGRSVAADTCANSLALDCSILRWSASVRSDHAPKGTIFFLSTRPDDPRLLPTTNYRSSVRPGSHASWDW